MRTRASLPALALWAVATLSGASAAHAADAPGPCRSPRAAAQQFLDNLQPDQMLPNDAIKCFARPAGMSDAELIQRARDLKAVLDARGLYVIMDDLSDDADFKDERGRHRSPLVEGYEPVELRRDAGAWRFPPNVVDRIPALYRGTFSGWTEKTLQRLPPVFRKSILGHEVWQFVGLALLLGLCWLVSRIVRALVKSRLVVLLRRWKIDSSSALLQNVARPLGILAATGLFAALFSELRLPISTARVLTVAARLVAALAGVVLAYRLVDVFAMHLEARARATAGKMDDQLVTLVRKTLRVVVVAVGVVFVLQNLHIDVTSLLAGLGIGGLALALAAKDTAANLFGSVTIMIDAPFYVGDWIKANDVEGTVVEIGLRSTRVRTFYDSIISVPNSVLATASIDNMSRRTYRRISTRFGIGYDSTPAQVQAFCEGIRAIIANHPDTRKDAYEVHFVDYGESALEIMFYAFVKVDAWTKELLARHEMFLSIKRLAAEIGVDFAFPTRTLHIDTQAEATDRRRADAPEDEALVSAVEGFGPQGRHAARGKGLTHGFFAGVRSARGSDDDGDGE
ncbi:MAG: mechanosensitive ion channel [Myxococcales bacterium]|nr:mechanosensitive ion channel [Myxococcales bacterium]MCB9538030.1 mechanosensitive ion channel [Myxococcales bacterium]